MFIRTNSINRVILVKAVVLTLAISALLFQPLYCPARSQASNVRYRMFEMAQVEEGTVWYLAEGCTEGGFETFILVQNPAETPAQVTLTFMTGEGPQAGPSETLQPGTRRTWKANDYVTSWDVSTKVEADAPVIAERAVYWDGRRGGHDSTGVTSTANVWYLAEGSTGGDFETWVLIQNPGEREARVQITYQGSEGSIPGPELVVPAGSRKSINVADTCPGWWDVSTKVMADAPVIAERAMYWSGRADGHDCTGVTIPAKRWYLAEGSTGGDFETWVLIQNPGENPANVKLTFQGSDGPHPGPELVVPAGSRKSINVADTCPGFWDVSTLVEADAPVIAERAMYWGSREGGHDSSGVATPERAWYLAEGSTGGDFETWVLIQNPGENPANVKLTFQGSDGPHPGPELVVPAGSRKSINVADTCPGFWDVSTLVEADAPVIAERAMYWGGRRGGHDSVGYPPRLIEIPETTNVLPGDTLGKLDSVSGGGAIMVFSSEDGVLSRLSIGDVIVCGVSAKTPTGLLRRITGIDKSGGHVTLTTEEVTLEETMNRGSLKAHITLTPGMVAQSQSLVAGVDLGDTYSAQGLQFSIPMKDVVLYKEGSKEVKLTGGITFEPSFDVDMSIDYDPSRFWEPPELKKFSFTTTLMEKAEIKLVAGVDLLNLKGEVELAKYMFSPITFFVGSIPVVLVPTLTVKLGASGKVSTSMSTGVTQQASVTAGLSYAGGIWEPVSGFENTFDFQSPTIKAGAEAKAYIKPQLSLMLYTLAGPHASIEGYLKLIADPTAEPWWSLRAGIKGDVGAEIRVLSKVVASYSKTVFDKSWLLAGAEGAIELDLWNKNYGGANNDHANDIKQTKDEGYILAGETESFGAGLKDAYLIKTKADGQSSWQKTFGGADDDTASSIQQTSDGGYILAGTTKSYGAGEEDAWLIKTDSSGNLSWQKTFGGTAYDAASSVQQTSDGGYILAGTTKSYGAGEEDAWLIKTDSSGNLSWQKTFGGTAYDAASSVQQTSDGGYILSGGTDSDVSYRDVFVVKTNSSGNPSWQKKYSGRGIEDEAFYVCQTGDSGYIIAGRTGFYQPGGADAYIIRIDSSGNLIWDEDYGGTNNDAAICIRQARDGGFVFAGWYFHSYEYGYQAWIVKLNPDGTFAWERFFGGEGTDAAYSIIQASDYAYILAGAIQSTGSDGEDVLLIKTDFRGS